MAWSWSKSYLSGESGWLCFFDVDIWVCVTRTANSKIVVFPLTSAAIYDCFGCGDDFGGNVCLRAERFKLQIKGKVHTKVKFTLFLLTSVNGMSKSTTDLFWSVQTSTVALGALLATWLARHECSHCLKGFSVYLREEYGVSIAISRQIKSVMMTCVFFRWFSTKGLACTGGVRWNYFLLLRDGVWENMTGAYVDIAVSSKWVKVCFSANYLF